MEIQGKIKFIGADDQVSASFVKREIVITTEEQYPQHIQIQFVQDKVDLLDAYKVGQSVEIGINLRGREWVNPQGETKYFNTIQGWKIKKLGDAPEGTPATPTAPSTPAPTATRKLVMIGKGLDHPYETWIASKWTDDLLVHKGYAKWEESAPAMPNAPAGTDPDLPF